MRTALENLHKQMTEAIAEVENRKDEPNPAYRLAYAYGILCGVQTQLDIILRTSNTGEVSEAMEEAA
jgi:hypothetical protein